MKKSITAIILSVSLITALCGFGGTLHHTAEIVIADVEYQAEYSRCIVYDIDGNIYQTAPSMYGTLCRDKGKTVTAEISDANSLINHEITAIHGGDNS